MKSTQKRIMNMKSVVNESEITQRADILLANEYKQYSRAALSKLFAMGAITIDGTKIKAGEKIKAGQSFDADLSELEKEIEPIDLPVLYEDDNVIVIDKPVGVISHARGKYWDEPSVASFIRQHTAGLEGERAGIVHRLDRATSGVMICAKNPTTLSALQKQFAQRKTKKSYYAVVVGTPDPAKALIDVPLGRNPSKPQTFRPDTTGKHATTAYEVIKSGPNYSLVKLTPLTGRTHQIRIHLQYIKHPILGDELYGDTHADRLFLHAQSLEITIPGGVRKVFESPLPASFEDSLKG
jgi:23S rRNA pseudouridine1911/1915/1917 synthase